MLTSIQRLKIRLMTDGVAVSNAARAVLAGENGTRPLTLADYASTSGIAMELEEQIWVNAPIAEFNPNFVRATPYRLEWREGKFFIRFGDTEVGARPMPVPSYFNERDENGIPYVDYAITHTDRVRISPVQGCTLGCRFCDLPFRRRYEFKPLQGLLGSVRRALQDEALPARHILISGGVPREEDWPKLFEVYEAVPSTFPKTPVDVMMVPIPGRLDVRRLHAAGVQGLSVNLELFDRGIARAVMKGKSRVSLRAFWDFIDDAVNIFGPGRIRSLLMVGLESMDSTLAGVRALAERGCQPVLSPFRPDPATPMRDVPPPTAEQLENIYVRAVEIATHYGIQLGPQCIPCMHNTLSFPDRSDCGRTTKGQPKSEPTAKNRELLSRA